MRAVMIVLWVGLCLARISPAGGQIPEGSPDAPVAEPATQPPEESGGEAVEATEAGPEEATFRDQVIVTATARESRTIDLPYSVETLTGDDLRGRRMARTVPEALREVPGIRVQKTSHGQGSPFLRGFTGYRTLFLVDGIRLNNSVFRDGPNQYWTTVDSLGLERLEVVRGPVSVLYGSDAIGGTVSAFSAGVGSKDGVSGRLLYRVSSAERSHAGRLEVKGRTGPRFGYSLGASGKAFGDVEAGGSVGRQPKTGYDEWNVDFKGVLAIDGRRDLVVGFQQTEVDDAWRTHRTVFGVPWRGTTVGSDRQRIFDQGRRLFYVQLHQREGSRFFDQLRASLSYQRQDEVRWRRRGDGRGDRSGFDVGTLGLWTRLSREACGGTWSYGFEVYRDRVDSFSDRFAAGGSFDRSAIQGPVADDSTYGLWGLYLQHERRLGERWTMLIGGRYTGVRAEAGRFEDPQTGLPVSFDQSWDQAVGNVRWLRRLGVGGRQRIYFGVSQGFRAPNLSDLTRLDTARSDEIETPSPDLEPEDFLSWELGWKAEPRGWTAELALFQTDIDDMIIRVPTGRRIDGDHEVTKKNAGDGFVRGVEVRGTARLGRGLELFADFAWLEGEVDTFPTPEPVVERQPIDRRMPATGHLGLRWQTAADRGWLELLLTVADRQDRLSTRDQADRQRIPPGGTPGYDVFTVRGGWELTDRISLSAAVENLGDEEYRIHGSGLNEPGRSLVSAVELRF